MNLNQLDIYENGSVVDAIALADKGLIKSSSSAVKILGNGELSKNLKVAANKFSQTAKDKIIAAGGTVEEIV